MTQITGHAEFCELFLDDVVVPKENLLSERGRRLEDRHAHARPRARHRGAAAAGQAAHVARPGGARRRAAGARRAADHRRPAGAGRARARVHRDRGAAPPRLPDRRRVPQRRRRRARQLEREAADGRGRAAAGRDGVRGPGADAPARRPGRGGGGSSSGPRPTSTRARRACTAARSRSSATSSPTASSRCPRSRAMDLELTDEQIWLSESVETLLSREWPAAELAADAGDAERERLWAALVEFGALAVDREEGLGAVELCLVARAAGTHLASIPYLGSAAAALRGRAVRRHRARRRPGRRSRCSSPAAAGPWTACRRPPGTAGCTARRSRSSTRGPSTGWPSWPAWTARRASCSCPRRPTASSCGRSPAWTRRSRCPRSTFTGAPADVVAGRDVLRSPHRRRRAARGRRGRRSRRTAARRRAPLRRPSAGSSGARSAATRRCAT